MRQFGLTQPLVVQLIEQLPNVEKCSEHDFHFHKPEKISSWQSQVRIHYVHVQYTVSSLFSLLFFCTYSELTHVSHSLLPSPLSLPPPLPSPPSPLSLSSLPSAHIHS